MRSLSIGLNAVRRSGVVVVVDIVAPEIFDLSVGLRSGDAYPTSFAITEPATVDFVWTLSATQPTPVQVAAGLTDTGVGAPSSGEFAVTTSGPYDVTVGPGLNGSYYLHVSPIDAAGNRAATVDTFGPVVIDTVAPVQSLPTNAAVGADSSNISSSTNKSGGSVFYVHPATASVPTGDQIVAGRNAAGVVVPSGSFAAGSVGVNSGGASGSLGELTTYFTHMVQRDASFNLSNVVTPAGSFTTGAIAVTYALRAPAVVAYANGPNITSGLVSITARVRFRLPAADAAVVSSPLIRATTTDFALRVDARTTKRRLQGMANNAAGTLITSANTPDLSLTLNTAYDAVYSATQNLDTGGFAGSRIYLNGVLSITSTAAVAGDTFRVGALTAMGIDQFAFDLFSVQMWYNLWMPTYDGSLLVSPNQSLLGAAAYWNAPTAPGWSKQGAGVWT